MIPGVTLNLTKKDATVSIDVASDDAALGEQVTAFVQAYNSLVQFANSQSAAAANGDASSIGRDPLLRGLRNRLRSAIGAAYTGGVFSRLSEVGVEFTQTGTLQLNQTIFAAAVSDHPDDLRQLFAGAGGAFPAVTGMLAECSQAGGFLSTFKTQLTQQSSSLDRQIAAMQDRLAIQKAALQKEFSAADDLISQLQSQSSAQTNFAASLQQNFERRLVPESTMKTPNHAVDSYRRTQVQASTPLEQVVLLYDGALKFMSEARGAMERRDIAARRVAVSRTLAIVGELRGTLDMERGGEIAVSLERLYGYAQNRLLEAVMHHDVRGIDDASKVFETLRDAWRTVATSAAQTARGRRRERAGRSHGRGAIPRRDRGRTPPAQATRRDRRPATRGVGGPRLRRSFQGPSDERDRLTRDLVTIEEGLRKVRALLADHREQAERTPGYDRTVALHREASDLVARILTTDKAALHALADAEVARRAALSGIEHGEATLAGYRKVLAPPSSGSSLFDTRG